MLYGNKCIIWDERRRTSYVLCHRLAVASCLRYSHEHSNKCVIGDEERRTTHSVYEWLSQADCVVAINIRTVRAYKLVQSAYPQALPGTASHDFPVEIQPLRWCTFGVYESSSSTFSTFLLKTQKQSTSSTFSTFLLKTEKRQL